MRVSPAGLVVGLAVMLAVLVQVRTVLAFLGYPLSGMQSVILFVVVLGGITVWAVLPELTAVTA